ERDEQRSGRYHGRQGFGQAERDRRRQTEMTEAGLLILASSRGTCSFSGPLLSPFPVRSSTVEPDPGPRPHRNRALVPSQEPFQQPCRLSSSHRSPHAEREGF